MFFGTQCSIPLIREAMSSIYSDLPLYSWTTLALRCTNRRQLNRVTLNNTTAYHLNPSIHQVYFTQKVSIAKPKSKK